MVNLTINDHKKNMATCTFYINALWSEVVLKSKLMSVKTGIRQNVIFFVVLKFFVTSRFSWYIFQSFFARYMQCILVKCTCCHFFFTVNYGQISRGSTHFLPKIYQHFTKNILNHPLPPKEFPTPEKATNG